MHNVKLGVRIPSDSLVRQLFGGNCLRQTMNSWFAHGQPFTFQVAPEVCCSSCMGQCMCARCKEKCLALFLSSLKVSEEMEEASPSYEPSNLAEVLIENLLEFEDLIIFKDFLAVFSLGDKVSNLVFNFLEPKFKDIVDFKSVTETATDTRESIDALDSSSESDGSDLSEDGSDYFDDTDSD